MEIRKITQENAGDLRLKNEPFAMPGRFIPALKDGVWTYRTETSPECQWMTFPDEAYDFETVNREGAAFGAYEDGVCIVVAIYQDYYFSYMYLLDLKVSSAARGKGVGKALIEAGMAEAKARGYRGLYTQGQDDNLNACMFYLKAGFTIGGFDNRVYRGTKQENKADVIFYKE